MRNHRHRSGFGPDARKLSEALAGAQKGNLKRAVAVFEQATRGFALNPQIAAFARDLYAAVGNEAFDRKRYNEALNAFELSHRHDPSHPGILLNIGNALIKLNDFNRAKSVLGSALAIQRDNINALLSLSAAHFQLEELESAERLARKAAAAAPNAPAVWFNLATILKGQNKLRAASSSYQRSLKLFPNNLSAKVGLIQTKQLSCDWSSFEKDAESLEEIASQGAPVQASMMLSHQVSPRSLLLAAQAHAQTIASDALPRISKKRDTDIVKIGYVSNDFRQHPVAQLLPEVLALHDRSHFHVTAYSYGPNDGSIERQRVREGVDLFTNIDHLTSKAVAEMIRRDGIDILIDLKGYTGYPRTDIFASRPSPVQVQYLGYPGTMGAAWMDYIIADPIVLPPELESGFTEAIARLPHCFMPRDRRYEVKPPPSRAECQLPEDAFVIACFNNAYKITPDVWAVWMSLLHRIPDAVLWLSQTTTEAEQNLRRSARLCGIPDKRIAFATWAPTLADHFSRLQNADLMIDTLHYGAHTTANDALWVGVPVVTCLGKTFQSRVAASLLHAAGIPEFVADSLKSYEMLALHWSNNRNELSRIRQMLVTHRDKYPLFDMNAYTRSLERAFLTMLETQRLGKPPTTFTLSI